MNDRIEQSATSSPTRNILVVGSDSQLAEFARLSLDNRTYNVVTTEAEGDELEGILRESQPDLVIVDLDMPAMQGIEALLRIREWSSAPTLLLSTWRAGKMKVRCFDLDSVNWLGTPVGSEELSSWVSMRLFHGMALRT